MMQMEYFSQLTGWCERSLAVLFSSDFLCLYFIGPYVIPY